jgi:site-specific recombinase
MPSTSDLILSLFPPAEGTNKSLRELASLVDRLTSATTLKTRLDAAMDLATFNRTRDRHISPPLSATLGSEYDHDARWRRLAVWLSILEVSPEVRRRYQQSVAALLAETNGVSLFADSGLPSDRGLLSELSNRLFALLLPAPRDYSELARLFVRMFPTRDEVEHFFSLPPEHFDRMVALEAPEDAAPEWQPVVQSLLDSFSLLGARVQGLGLSEKLRVRSLPRPVQQSPFYRLTHAGDDFVHAVQEGQATADVEKEWRSAVQSCKNELHTIELNMDKRGVNLDVVYALDVIAQCLHRMESIATVLSATPGHPKRLAVQYFLKEVIRGRLSDRSITVLLRNSLSLLARKIVEWAGKTGEHYISATREEYWAMWRAALGGGLLTVGTAAIKMFVTHADLRAFPEGFLAGLNYAVSFLILQTFHLALATKQPSMTGATLAQIVLRRERDSSDDELVTYVARIFRTQLAAAFGNIIAVGAGAVGLAFLWRMLFGAPILNTESAEYAVTSLNPLHTGTVFYAALTGVILWLSSIIGGWIENWAVYHRLPEAIADHRLGAYLHPDRLQRVSRTFSRNISGWGGSIALGFMLGLTPSLGRFFGLPLDVRHVTLSTGTVALGAVSLSRETMPKGALLWAALGIAVTFVLNLSVSFYLALRLALQAHGADLGGNRAIFRTLWSHFRQSPRQFFFPPPAQLEPAPAETDK